MDTNTSSLVTEPTTTVDTPPATTRRRPSWLGVATLVSLVAFVYFAFVFAPEDELQGPMQRIFYVHVPSAWVCFLAFAIVFGASIGYLSNRKLSWDTVAAACAEVGFLCTSVVLVTGMMWGHVIWGVYWTWEPRLTSFLILWLLYLSYLALRAYVPDPARRARFSAVVGIVAFLDVPIIYLSVKWWRTLHPEQVIITDDGPHMPAAMLVALMVGLVTFSLLFAYLVRMRLQISRMQATLEEVSE